MSEHGFYRPSERRLITPGSAILLALMAAGLLAAIYRFIMGLGPTTHLTDQYPWGIWVAFDVVCGVALAAGGFTTAAVVYIFWGEKYHGLVRPAVLTGFLGYFIVAMGLMADLGLPWHIWHPIIFWPKHSALFEVAWCVMLYLTVLALEFLPSVFERFKLDKLYTLYNKLVPWFIVLALSWFTYIMSLSIVWSLAALVVLSLIALFLPKLVHSDRGVPVLLIIAGILFSTAHQSSLGTLFLLTQDKLHHLWWTPMLPVNFFVSATAVGFAMVIFESTISSQVYRRPFENKALAGFGKIMVGVLLVYLVMKLVDVSVRGQLEQLASWYGVLFAAELIIGVIIPIVMLLSPRIRDNIWPRFWVAVLVIFGLIFNRFNVTLVAMRRPGEGHYFPSPEEILITVALVSAIMFLYNVLARFFPVLPEVHEDEEEDAGGGSAKASGEPAPAGE